MNDEVSQWLQELSPKQIELVKEKLDQLIEEKKARIRNPGAVSLDDLAANLGLDITTLSRDIHRKVR